MRFFVLEGGDAAGKSKQAKKLKAWLEAQTTKPVIHCREPGGTPVAEELREIHRYGQSKHNERITEDTRVLLMNAARRQHVEHVIAPMLARGYDVVCERFNWSTYVYVTGESRKLAETLHTAMFQHIVPDCIIYLDIDPETAVERIKKRDELDDLEVSLTPRFQEMRHTFQQLVKHPLAPAPRHCFMVDGTQDEDTVFADIIAGLSGLV
jgi:dTMP kinase